MANKQKIALVTGGAKRVGRAISLGLANAGYAVAVNYNSSSADADSLVAEITEKGGEAIAVQADLFSPQQTRNLIPEIETAMGKLDLLINNASVFHEDQLDSLDDELWDRHFNLHVRTPALLTAAMASQQPDDGLIINIIDERVWKLTPNFVSYTLSKSALWTATKTFAQALAPNIRVNAIGPGPTLPSYRQTQDDFDRQVDTLLLKRSPQLDEFVNTILYLANNRSITGQMIALDGGQHLGWQTPDQLLPE